jgi:hypothetical protein
MKMRRLIATLLAGGAVSLAAGTTAVLVPAAYASTAATVPPICVATNLPGGATLQVGYAPNGPSNCHVVA